MRFYPEGVYRHLCDLYWTFEFGDELNLLLNFQLIAFDTALRATSIPGVTETIPTNRSLGIVYDPFVTTRERLVGQLKEIEQRMGEIKQLPSRHITIPIW